MKRVPLSARSALGLGAGVGVGGKRPMSAISGSDPHLQEMSEGKDNILVTVRVRPEADFERTAKFRNIIRVLDKNVLVFDPQGPVDEDSNSFFGNSTRRCKDMKYAFDRIFDGTTTQLEVYEGTTKFLIDGVLNGYNATVFAYGATGAGKTYTMMGCDHSGPGVMVLTMIDLFKAIENSKADRSVNVYMSYLEVYNEQIRDLLNPSTKSQLLELREDKAKGMCVANLSQVTPSDADEVLRLLEEGNRNRTQHPTEANATSSRSHAVLQIIIEQQDRASGIKTDVRYAKLSLIDLAGSERAAVTKNSGIRLTEGANINKSLLALGNCINALALGNSGYVPYRNSKLTRLLKDSLGGNCRTVMIAALSPSSFCFEDTHNTLKYANRAKNIKTKVERNVLNVNFHISEYTRIIADLRAQVEELRTQATARSAVDHQHMPSNVTSMDINALRDEVEFDIEQKRLHEQETMDALRFKINNQFQELMRLKRSIMELEERERQALVDIDSKKSEIAEWSESHPDDPMESMPVRIITLQREVSNLEHGSGKYAQLHKDLAERYKESERHWKQVADEVPRLISSREARFALEQCLQVRELEIKNMELSCVIDRQKRTIENMEVKLFDGDEQFLGLNARRLSYSDFLVTPLRGPKQSIGGAGAAAFMSPAPMLNLTKFAHNAERPSRPVAVPPIALPLAHAEAEASMMAPDQSMLELHNESTMLTIVNASRLDETMDTSMVSARNNNALSMDTSVLGPSNGSAHSVSSSSQAGVAVLTKAAAISANTAAMNTSIDTVPTTSSNSSNNNNNNNDVTMSATKNKENAMAFHISLAERRKAFKQMKQAWTTPREREENAMPAPPAGKPKVEIPKLNAKKLSQDPIDDASDSCSEDEDTSFSVGTTTTTRSVLDRLCKPTVSSRQKKIKKSVKFVEGEEGLEVAQAAAALQPMSARPSMAAREVVYPPLSARMPSDCTGPDRPLSAPPTVSVNLQALGKENQPMMKIGNLKKIMSTPSLGAPLPVNQKSS
eukprot:ANDGO_03650.mRNA.1 Kinesin-like protein 5